MDELKHWGEKKNHKYVARIPLKRKTKKRKYRYFYTKEEWQAYLKDRRSKEATFTKPLQKEKDVKKKDKAVRTDIKSKKFINDFMKKFGDKNVKTLGNTSELASQFIMTLFDKGIGKATVTTTYLKKLKDEAYSKVDKAVKSFSELKKKNKEYTKDEDMAEVNPNYDPYDPYYSMNCPWCTAAYDLRQRGYDVEAGPNNAGEFSEDILDWYDGAELLTLDDMLSEETSLKKEDYTTRITEENRDIVTELVEQRLIECGEGARGHFMVTWESGGGHDVVWEIENNTVVLRDTQTNNKHTVEEFIDRSQYVEIIRTDNVEPNDEILKAVRNKKRR